MDAYVLIRDADQGSFGKIMEYPEVRFASPMTGPYLGIAVVTVEDLSGLASLVLGRFREAGIRQTETALAVRAMQKLVKWLTPTPVEAFVRIWVEPGKAQQVLEALDAADWTMGAAVCAADFDILLEVGGDTFEEVVETLLRNLHPLEGIVRTATSFAVGQGARQG